MLGSAELLWTAWKSAGQLDSLRGPRGHRLFYLFRLIASENCLAYGCSFLSPPLLLPGILLFGCGSSHKDAAHVGLRAAHILANNSYLPSLVPNKE